MKKKQLIKYINELNEINFLNKKKEKIIFKTFIIDATIDWTDSNIVDKKVVCEIWMNDKCLFREDKNICKAYNTKKTEKIVLQQLLKNIIFHGLCGIKLNS